MVTLEVDHFSSPIGEVVIGVENGGLVLLDFGQNDERIDTIIRRRRPETAIVPARNPADVTSRLAAYFDGELHAIDDIAVNPTGTPFRRALWLMLRTIAVGTTTTYGELAARLGQPQAARAVGAANGANPIGIVLPCHRVLGANGKLTGYAGGIERKHWLLRHEGVLLA